MCIFFVFWLILTQQKISFTKVNFVFFMQVNIFWYKSTDANENFIKENLEKSVKIGINDNLKVQYLSGYIDKCEILSGAVTIWICYIGNNYLIEV